ncbi:MAG: ATPase, partial [Desulfuromonadales bacterium]|nr:ATPase [Desulfuromonadales bacterium]
DYRLVVAGGLPGLFADDAVQLIHQASGGVPRKINQIASLALLEGFGREVRPIDSSVLESVMNELDLLI